MEGALDEAWRQAQKEIELRKDAHRYTEYQQRPVEFCVNVLGDYFTEDVIKVIESVRDNPVTIAQSANNIGKTHAAARVGVWFYEAYPDSQVFVTAAPPEENLKKMLWAHIRTIVRTKPGLFSGHRMRALTIERYARSFITGVTIPTTGTVEDREAKFSGKHAPQILFIVDEGDAVPDEVYKGIESCMSGGFARLLIMFNPRAKAGPVWRMQENGLANVVHLSALNHPNVVSGRESILGAVNRETVVRRFNMWTRELGQSEEEDDNCILVPDFLIGEVAEAPDGHIYPPLQEGYRKITDPEFWYMVLGLYPTQSSRQLFDEIDIQAALDRHKNWLQLYGEVPPPGVQPILSLDVAEFGSDDNCSARRYGGYIAPLETWNGLDVDQTGTRILDLYNQYNAWICQVDATGVGAGIAPRMCREGRDKSVRAFPVKFAEKPLDYIKTESGDFYNMQAQMCWAFREWLRNDPTAMLPNDALLLEEMRSMEYEKDQKGKIRVTDKKTLRKKLKRSPDRFDAVMLTFAPYERAKSRRLTD